MRPSTGVLFTSIAALCLAAPTASAGRQRMGLHFYGMAPHFAGMQRPFHPQAYARHFRGNGSGLGDAYSTFLSGKFETAPPDEQAGFVVPPPFYGAPPPPPPSCVRPLLIHLVPAQHPKLPRVVYGTPFTCPG
jgi:hypothetical protein